jgi:16S rRNA (cytosine967-C5)-methyltransferase
MRGSEADSPMTAEAPALNTVLLPAARAVAAVRDGRSAAGALAAAPESIRPAAQSVSFLALRRMGLADALKSALVRSAPADPLLDALLTVALALLCEASDAPYADHTVVNEAVTAAGRDRRLARYKAMVNGVLRTFLRERDARLQAAMKDPVARWNYPAWWIDAVRQAWPAQWQDVLAAANTRPSMMLRVNRRRADAARVVGALQAAAAPALAMGGDAVVLERPAPLSRLPGFSEGWWSVQDAGAQLAAPLLDVRDGMRVLDACAAPGGKTCHILESCDAEVTALDSDPVRLEKVRENLARLGLRAALLTGDATDPSAWWDGRPFDRILLDAPCTASGIVRRHPEIRWLRRASDVAVLATIQARMLDALWPLLAPDGKLLYVTCSILPREGEEQASDFAARHRDARRLPAPGQLLPTMPTAPPGPDHDGFFFALFQRT